MLEKHQQSLQSQIDEATAAARTAETTLGEVEGFLTGAHEADDDHE